MRNKALAWMACASLVILAAGALADSNSAQQWLGFNSSPGFQIGSTYFDAQHNSRMARQIVVGNGWVHNAWTFLPAASTANRKIQYYAWQIGGPGVVSNADVDSSISAGYTSLDYDLTDGGAAVVGYHRTTAGGTMFSRDSGPAAGTFSLRHVFSAANCQGIVSGVDAVEGPYIWPVIAIDSDNSGDALLHCVSTESNTTYPDMQSIVYYRSSPNLAGPGASCGFWIDSVQNIVATICADPASDAVAIVYFQPADYSQSGAIQQRNNTVVYRESSDLGSTWGRVVDVTNYTGSDLERAYSDVSAMYTSDGCLHIAWIAANFDSSTGSLPNGECRLRHWDDCGQCISTIQNAQHSEMSCDRGSWQDNIARVSLSECQVGAQKNLYATYTYFLGSDTGIPGPSDCSTSGYANGELFMQVSSTDGLTWGPPINLTNTTSPGCSGDCASENWSSSAMYVTDSLRLQYLLDLDAGRVSGSEGTWTNNPVMNMAVPCVAATPYASISITPAQIVYPEIYLMPDSVTSKTLILSNSGNINAVVTRKVEYLDGNGWLSFPDLDSVFVVPAGCVNTQAMTMVVTAPYDEGFYDVNVHFVYDNGTAIDTTTLSFRLWDLCGWVDDFSTFRTTCNKLEILRTARARWFYDYSDSNEYLYDASLIMGNSASKLCWSIYKDYESWCRPTYPAGRLFGLSGFYVITNENDYPSYRKGSAYGRNDDSTLGYSVDFYAPKHPDSCEFVALHFKIYKGLKDPEGIITTVNVAFAADWNIMKYQAQETGFTEPSLSLLYQRAPIYSSSNYNYAGIAGFNSQAERIVGGFIWDAATHVYPGNDFVSSDLWNQFQALTPNQYISAAPSADLVSCLTLGRNKTINGSSNDTLKYVVIMAKTRNTSNSTQLIQAVRKGANFAANHGLMAPLSNCMPGDADSNGLWTISDAVYLISHIFAGGPPPAATCRGDANCDCILTISDAVYLINYIFAGGPSPVCLFICK